MTTAPASKLPTTDASLLTRTLAGAVKDPQLVTPEGKSVDASLEGVSFHDVPTHSDSRGTVVEMYDPRWEWHPDPLVFAYTFTLRPGCAKGRNLHKLHDDRYCLLQGEMELYLYDVRPDSSTCGSVSKIVITEHHRRLVNIPRFVWHADANIGSLRGRQFSNGSL